MELENLSRRVHVSVILYSFSDIHKHTFYWISNRLRASGRATPSQQLELDDVDL